MICLAVLYFNIKLIFVKSFYTESEARLERSSFFASTPFLLSGNVYAKNSGSGRRISCPNHSMQ